MKRFLSTFLFLILSGKFLFSQQISQKLDSKVFGGERKFTVYLPESFKLDSAANYPVAYLFDGQFTPYFTMVCGMMEYYSQSNNGMSFIVVSVETDDRHKEFIPQKKENGSYYSPLTEFLQTELFPLIEKSYPISNFRLGIGHSLGGTYVMYEMFRENALFDAIIAASPNTAQTDLPTLIPEFLQKHPEKAGFAYSAGGDTDFIETLFSKASIEIDSVVKSLNLQNLNWTFESLMNTNHMESFPQTFDRGYRKLSERCRFSGFYSEQLRNLEGKALVDNFVSSTAKISEIRKSKLTPDFEYLMNLQTEAVDNGDYTLAYKLNVITYALIDSGMVNPKQLKDGESRLKNRKEFYYFRYLCDRAKQLSDEGEFEKSAGLYKTAFDTGVKNGTHMQRLASMTAFAKTNRNEEAFKQMELLANYFELQGSHLLTSNELLNSLHADKRWAKYIEKLDKNLEKAKAR